MAGKGIQIIVGADYSGKELQRAINDLEKLKRETQTAGQKFAAFGKGMQTVGKNMSLFVSLPLAAAGAAALAFSADFGRSMANVASLIPGNTQRVEELKSTLMDLGPEVGKSLGDLSGGLYQVISAFGDTADTVSILETNARAATAGLSTTTQAIDLTSAVTKAYGDTSAAAVTQVSDLALMAVRLGQTTFPELAGAIGRVTPLTAELGVSQEELFGVMATFTGVTGGAAEVSTQLRGVLQSMLAPTADMTRALKDAGIESTAALIQQQGLGGAIQFMVDAAAASGQPLQKFIGSIEGQTIALAITGEQADDYTDKLAAMGDAAGTTDAAFNEVTTGVGETAFTFDQLKAQAEVVAVSFGDGIAPALMAVLDAIQPLIDGIIGLAEGFANLDPGMQAFVVFLGGALALAGPVILIVGQMVTAFGALKTALIGAVGATNALKFTLISSGIGAALVVVSSAIAALAFSNSQASADIKTFNDGIRDQNGLLRENATEQSRLRLESLGYLDIADQAGVNQYDLAKAYAEGGDALNSYIAVLQKYADTAFDVGTEEGRNQRAAVMDLVEELETQRDVTNENAEAQREFAKAQSEATFEAKEHRAHADKATDSINENGSAASDAAAEQRDLAAALEQTTTAFLELSGLLDERANLRAYEAAVDDFKTTVEETGVALDIGTPAGRDFEDALDGIFSSALRVAEAQETAEGKVATLKGALRDARAVLAELPMTDAERAALLKPLTDAIAEANGIGQAVDDIPDYKQIIIDIITNYKTGGGAGGIPPPLGGAAFGGLVRGPGGPRDDMVPTRLSNGEFVIQAAAVKKFGVQFLSMLNAGRMPASLMSEAPGPSRPMPARSGGGLTINGGITVTQVGGEPAERSLPRALRRMAWQAGLDG